MSVYVGIDVHRKRSQVAVIDDEGKVLANRNVPNGVEPVLGVIGGLPPGTPAAFEAAFGWGWLVELPYPGSGHVHHREKKECGPPPPANGYRTGPAGSESGSGLPPPGLRRPCRRRRTASRTGRNAGRRPGHAAQVNFGGLVLEPHRFPRAHNDRQR